MTQTTCVPSFGEGQGLCLSKRSSILSISMLTERARITKKQYLIKKQILIDLCDFIHWSKK